MLDRHDVDTLVDGSRDVGVFALLIATDPVVVGWLTAKYGAAAAHQVEIGAAVVGAVLVLVVGGAWRRTKVQAESKA